MATSDALRKARAGKNDEFYTQISDIDLECGRYREHFRGKTIFCNCDDPYTSEFFKYFAISFKLFGLKRLIAASYDPSPIAGTQLPFEEIAGMKGSDKKAYVFDSTSVPDNLDDTRKLLQTVKEVVRPLQGNGDFRSAECVELLKQADIVVTNPPFSLFREFMAQLVKYDKQFLIIGNINCIAYKEEFRLIRENKVWLGFNNFDSSRFVMPSYYDITQSKYAYEEKGIKYGRVSGLRWFTNLDNKIRHEALLLYKKYSSGGFLHYDNFDAIDVGKVVEIPIDYNGMVGVPVTFLDKYNPDQFEILGLGTGEAAKELGVKVNYRGRTDLALTINGKHTCPYNRIIIRRREGWHEH